MVHHYFSQVPHQGERRKVERSETSRFTLEPPFQMFRYFDVLTWNINSHGVVLKWPRCTLERNVIVFCCSLNCTLLPLTVKCHLFKKQNLHFYFLSNICIWLPSPPIRLFLADTGKTYFSILPTSNWQNSNFYFDHESFLIRAIGQFPSDFHKIWTKYKCE